MDPPLLLGNRPHSVLLASSSCLLVIEFGFIGGCVGYAGKLSHRRRKLCKTPHLQTASPHTWCGRWVLQTCTSVPDPGGQLTDCEQCWEKYR